MRYVLYMLPPYYAHVGKRLIKSPKLYFCDTGLLCYLLGVADADALRRSDFFGAVCENLIVAETLKAHLNRGERPDLYFYRDDSKAEVDLLDFTDLGQKKLVEVKSGATYRSSWARHLESVGEALGVGEDGRFVACRVERGFDAQGAHVRTLADWMLGA